MGSVCNSQTEYNGGYMQSGNKQDMNINLENYYYWRKKKTLKTITTHQFLKCGACLNIYLFQMNNERQLYLP